MSDLSDLYQELILDHNKRPRNCRKIEGPDCCAQGHNPLCGDRVAVFVNVKGDRIEEIAFQGAGCAISTASASLMTESLKGKTFAEAKGLFNQFHHMLTEDSSNGEVEAEGLGKLAAFSGVKRYPARVKCATLAWHTVNAALEKSGETVTTE